VNATRPALAGPTATTATESLLGPGDTVEEIQTFQRTARRIVRNPDLTVMQVCVALIRLAVEARRTQAPELCQAAIWTEAEVFVMTGERPMDREAIVEALHASDPVEMTLRRLVRDGYVRCPECTRVLPDERALDHRRTLARQSLEDALVREGAV
jgi:hypothetical protein